MAPQSPFVLRTFPPRAGETLVFLQYPPVGRGGLLVVDGGFQLVVGVWRDGVVLGWESLFLRRCASLPSRCLGRSRTAPTGGGLGVLEGGCGGWRYFCRVRWWLGGVLLVPPPGHPPLAFGIAPPYVFDEGGGGSALLFLSQYNFCYEIRLVSLTWRQGKIIS